MDDKDFLRNVTGMILSKLGYTVESAAESAEAIKCYEWV